MGIREDIERYRPVNRQEERDKAVMLDYIRRNPGAFFRSDLTAHMTASAWVVNSARDRLMMVHHNIFNAWTWAGGHADGDEDLLRVALREVREETGIESARPVSGEIFSLEILTVDGHEKRGDYVPGHLHMNLSYLFEADDTEPLRPCEGENSGVMWFTPEEALERSTEPWFVERIYKKLNAKVAEGL